ncbi:MAG: hypothetical protein WC100_03330 [Sterolibacterium sp.]
MGLVYHAKAPDEESPTIPDGWPPEWDYPPTGDGPWPPGWPLSDDDGVYSLSVALTDDFIVDATATPLIARILESGSDTADLNNHLIKVSFASSAGVIRCKRNPGDGYVDAIYVAASNYTGSRYGISISPYVDLSGLVAQDTITCTCSIVSITPEASGSDTALSVIQVSAASSIAFSSSISAAAVRPRLLVAVANSGNAASSDDGVSWAFGNGSENANWNDVAYSPTLGLFVAVASSGTNRVMTSVDGINWTGVSVPSESWNGICWGSGVFVAVASSGSSRMMFSTNGTTWTTQNIGTLAFQKVAFSPALSMYVAVSSAGELKYATQNNLQTSWTACTGTYFGSAAWKGVAWDATIARFTVVSAGGTDSAYSTDGISFTASSMPNKLFARVCGGGNLFVAVGAETTGGAASSTDGNTWTARNGIDSGLWFGVCYSPTLALYIAVGEYALGPRYCSTSPDGVTWTARSLTGGPWRAVCAAA